MKVYANRRRGLSKLGDKAKLAQSNKLQYDKQLSEYKQAWVNYEASIREEIIEKIYNIFNPEFEYLDLHGLLNIKPNIRQSDYTYNMEITFSENRTGGIWFYLRISSDDGKVLNHSGLECRDITDESILLLDPLSKVLSKFNNYDWDKFVKDILNNGPREEDYIQVTYDPDELKKSSREYTKKILQSQIGKDTWIFCKDPSDYKADRDPFYCQILSYSKSSHTYHVRWIRKNDIDLNRLHRSFSQCISEKNIYTTHIEVYTPIQMFTINELEEMFYENKQN